MSDIEKVINETRERIGRNQVIINGLENYEPFQMLLEDFKRQSDMIDQTWYKIPHDDPKVGELRITRLAAESIVDIINIYKHDLTRAKQHLQELENPDEYQGSYYDAE